VNRKGQDNIQVVQPELKQPTLTQYSVGRGTDPHDIFVLNDQTAFVTLYEPEANRSSFPVDDLMKIDPLRGIIWATLDLEPYTTNDSKRRPRADRILYVHNKLYISLQDLDPSYRPDTNGKVVVVNPDTFQVETVIQLTGHNPYDMAYSPETDRIYVSCTDYILPDSPGGGIEVIDPNTNQSHGILYTNAELGGGPGALTLGKTTGFVTVGFFDNTYLSFRTKVVRFDLTRLADSKLKVLYTGEAYIPTIALWDPTTLLLADMAPAVNGIVFLDPETGASVQETMVIGLPPVGISFFDRDPSLVLSGGNPSLTAEATIRYREGGRWPFPSLPSGRFLIPLPGSDPRKDRCRFLPDWRCWFPSLGGGGSTPTTCPAAVSPADPSLPFADHLVSYTVGEQGGFHEDQLPEIVLGPPVGNGDAAGGRYDIFSLGLGGEIVLEFQNFQPVDGEGADFIVFENTFSGFLEPARVSVSEDGTTWHDFPCDLTIQEGETLPSFEGCAGHQPTYANAETNTIDPTDPEVAGGDSYDLQDLGLCQVRFIRIQDINGCDFFMDPAHCSGSVSIGVLGFDLDAVSVVNGTSTTD
ncbi:MAG: hypothetical protein Q7S00_01545, partial [bacterium]|nr:hypothetical protein [bacterium]